MSATTETLEQVENLAGEGYKHGFVTDIEMEMAPKGPVSYTHLTLPTSIQV